jgi:hypothetical protein
MRRPHRKDRRPHNSTILTGSQAASEEEYEGRQESQQSVHTLPATFDTIKAQDACEGGTNQDRDNEEEQEKRREAGAQVQRTHVAHVKARPTHANFFHDVSAIAKDVANVAAAAQAVVHAPVSKKVEYFWSL